MSQGFFGGREALNLQLSDILHILKFDLSHDVSHTWTRDVKNKKKIPSTFKIQQHRRQTSRKLINIVLEDGKKHEQISSYSSCLATKC